MRGKRPVWPMLGLFLFFALLAGCGGELSPTELPAALARKLADVRSYQLCCRLESSGEAFAVCQWYQSPDRVRTDVAQADQPLYRFLYSAGRLQVKDMSSGQQQELTVATDNELFITPLLFGFYQQADEAVWEFDRDTRLYHGSFLWSDQTAHSKQGHIWVDQRTLLPTEIQLVLSDEAIVCIQVQTVALNPPLSEALFSLDDQ